MNPIRKAVIAAAMVGSTLTGGAIGAALFTGSSANAATPEERLKILQTETFPTIAKKVPSFSLFSAVNFHGLSKNMKGVYFFPNGPIDLSKDELT